MGHRGRKTGFRGSRPGFKSQLCPSLTACLYSLFSLPGSQFLQLENGNNMPPGLSHSIGKLG